MSQNFRNVLFKGATKGGYLNPSNVAIGFPICQQYKPIGKAMDLYSDTFIYTPRHRSLPFRVDSFVKV